MGSRTLYEMGPYTWIGDAESAHFWFRCFGNLYEKSMVQRSLECSASALAHGRPLHKQLEASHRNDSCWNTLMDIHRIGRSPVCLSWHTASEIHCNAFSFSWNSSQVAPRCDATRHAAFRCHLFSSHGSASVLVLFQTFANVVAIFYMFMGRHSAGIHFLRPCTLFVASCGHADALYAASVDSSTKDSFATSQEFAMVLHVWSHVSDVGPDFWYKWIIFFCNQGSTTLRKASMPGRSTSSNVLAGHPNHRTTASVFKISGKSMGLTCGPAIFKRSSSVIFRWGTYNSWVGTRIKMSSKSKLKKLGTLEKSSFLACGLHLLGLSTKTWSSGSKSMPFKVSLRVLTWSVEIILTRLFAMS